MSAQSGGVGIDGPLAPLISVRELSIRLTDDSPVVDSVSLTIPRGVILGLAGESGSGKTSLAVALLNHARRGARITEGVVEFEGTELGSLPDNELRAIRGSRISYVPQDPAAALNPALRIGLQLEELFEEHRAPKEARNYDQLIRDVLEEVRLPLDAGFRRRYPHQLSGGQLQRICLAMAFLLNPEVVVLDEPTTGLDVTTQAHILRTIKAMCNNRHVAALYVTHDLAALRGIADRVAVMYAGRIVEFGPVEVLLSNPRHPYTRRLIEATPDIKVARRLPTIEGTPPRPSDTFPGCRFRPRCDLAVARCEVGQPPASEVGKHHFSYCFRADDVGEVQPVTPQSRAVLHLASEEPGGGESILVLRGITARHGNHVVVHDASLDLQLGESVALVGESGSGKTTLSRVIVGLHNAYEGEVVWNGVTLAKATSKRTKEQLRGIQYVFQSPYTALNPRRSVAEILEFPIRLFWGLDRKAAAQEAAEALDRVRLTRRTLGAYPPQLSGGERQRVAIARALVCRPSVLICDEVTSALDVSVQASIVNLLHDLRERESLSLVFVTHNLALVRSMCERTVVLCEGIVVESGATSSVLDTPASDYARKLVADTPTLLRGFDVLPRPS